MNSIVEATIGIVIGILSLGYISIAKSKGIPIETNRKVILVMFAITIPLMIGIIVYWCTILLLGG